MQQVKVSPDLVALLEVHEVDEQKETLVKLWREIENEVEQQKKLSRSKKRNIAAPKRARFSFD